MILVVCVIFILASVASKVADKKGDSAGWMSLIGIAIVVSLFSDMLGFVILLIVGGMYLISNAYK